MNLVKVETIVKKPKNETTVLVNWQREKLLAKEEQIESQMAFTKALTNYKIQEIELYKELQKKHKYL